MAPRAVRQAPGRAPRTGSERAFTLIELLAVVAIIGILAAAASPMFVRLLQDGRVGSAATNIADIYRVARSRALGRGSAVMVRFDNAASSHMVMREGIRGGNNANCAPSPSASCTGTNWSDSSSTSKFVTSFDERASQYQPAQAAFIRPAYVDSDGDTVAEGPVAFAEICFTPRGRTFVRFGATDAFEPLAAVPRVEVTNTRTSLVRLVVLPPSGAARVVSRL